MAYVKKRSVLPVYLVGATWLVWSLAAPLSSLWHYAAAALVSAIVYNVGKMIWPDRGYAAGEQSGQAAGQAQALAAPWAELVKPKSTGSKVLAALIAERDRAVS